MEELTQIWGRGRLFIDQLEICPLEVTYPGNFGQGGGNSGVYLRRKFCPGGGISALPPYKISAPSTEGCTTAREKGLSEISQGRKLWNFRSPGNSGLWSGISCPGENINTKMVVTFASGLRFDDLGLVRITTTSSTTSSIETS
jgi:hypothetical protein